ncbi:SDR family oxidoreductase, partial [Prochlorococcus sp. AH-736-K15]|nr:SDR family oxidoreductase [Prochlorococcus sp. AH-736-K15]
KLLELGHRVICVDNLMYEPTSLVVPASHPNCEFILGDCRDKDLMEPLIKKADTIFPLACMTGAPLCDRDKIAATTVNHDAVVMCSDLSSNSQRIIYPCTNSGYGIGEKGIYCDETSPLKPISLYGKVKVKAEKRLLQKGNAITFRLATVFGVSPRPRLDLLVNDFTYRAYFDRAVVLFEADFKRNYLHIEDAVDGFIFAMSNPQLSGQTFNLGYSNANLSKRELCQLIQKQLPKFVFLISEIGEDIDKRNYIVSNEKIEKAGFTASRSVEQGVKELIKTLPLLKKNQFANI